MAIKTVLVTLAFLKTIVAQSQVSQSSANLTQWTDEVQFVHETCQMLVLRDLTFEHFYSLDPFRKSDGVVELIVRLKGPSDGHILLTPHANESAPFYLIVMGSYENTQSEIRRSDWVKADFKLRTQGIMSEHQFRGFLIRYNENRGELWIHSEGSEMPLLYLHDPDPISIKFFSFSAYFGKTVQAAFNCKSKESHRLITPYVPVNSHETVLTPTPTPDPGLRKVLLRKGYDRVALPHSENSIGTTVEVSFTVTYYSIREQEQTFELHGWPAFSWLDPRLKWDANGREEGYLHFQVDEIWIPDLVVYNCARPEKIEYYGRTNCMVNSSGMVVWLPPSRIDTYCTLNILRWPRDIQQCSVKFGSWSYHEKQVDVALGYLKLYEGLDVENKEWILTSMKGRRDSDIYPCCPRDHYSSIVFDFVLKRRASGYFYSVAMPIALVCCLNIFVFWLPAIGGERITLGAINFLLSLLLLMFIRNQLPNANRVPYIVMLCGWNMLLSAIGMLTTVIVSATSRLTATYALPKFLRVILRPNILFFFCVGQPADPPPKPKRVSLRGSYKLSTLVRADESATAEETQREREMRKNKNDWTILASIVDRISFFVYGTVTLVLMFGLL